MITISCYIKKQMISFWLHAAASMNLEDNMPSEISQTQKDEYCLIPFLCGV